MHARGSARMMLPRMLTHTIDDSTNAHNNRTTANPAVYPCTLVTHNPRFASKGTTANDTVSMTNLHFIHMSVTSKVILGSNLRANIWQLQQPEN